MPACRSFGQCRLRTFVRCRIRGGGTMKNPLDSLWGTFVSGLILTVVLYFVVKNILG
jgi:hypothetical protein